MKKTTLFFALITVLLLFAQTPAVLAQVADSGVRLEPPIRKDKGSPARGTGSLTTTFDWDNSYAGNMFDIMPYEELSITGFDLNLSPPGETATVDVYYRVGSCAGHEEDPSAWTLFETGTTLIVGAGMPTFLNLDSNNKVLDAGTTYGFYVDLVSYSSTDQHLLYTSGGPNDYWNEDLHLRTHCGNASPAFSNSFYPRIWNGTVYYIVDDPEHAYLFVDPEPLIPGWNVTFTVTNARANAKTWIAYSFDGWGMTHVPVLNITLALANPAVLVGPKMTDWAGRVEWTFPVPMGIPPDTSIWFQAAQYNMTSYVARSTTP